MVIGMPVNRGEKYIIPSVENILRAITVMKIYIQNRHARRAFVQEFLRGYRCCIEQTIARHIACACMVTGRADKGKRATALCRLKGGADGATCYGV